MRVLINAATARMGGGARYVQELVPALLGVATDLEVTVLAPLGIADSLSGVGARVEAVTARGGAGSLTMVATRTWRTRRRVDVLYSPGNLAVPLPGCPQVIAIRNLLLFPMDAEGTNLSRRSQTGVSVRARLSRLSVMATAATIVPSVAMRAAVARTLPTGMGRRLHVVHHGLAGDLHADRERGRAARAALGVGQRPLIVYPTLSGPHKDYSTVVQAMAHMRNADCRLLLIAEPILAPGVWRLIRESALEDRILLVRRVPPHQMPVVYGMADVVIWASRVEAFGFPLLEAMRCRVPVVAADTSVNRELAADTVVYYAPGDALGLAASLDRILEAPDEERVESAFRRSLNFSWERSAGKVAEVLRRAAGTLAGSEST